MTLSIIIVSFNGRNHLEGCLLSVMKAIGSLETEVIVVDNNSTDGAPDMVSEKYPSFLLIKNFTNLGFAKACNMGARKATGKYLLFLNPDCLIAENTLYKTVDYLENHANTGALGVQMIDGCGRFLEESKRGNPSPLNSLGKLFGSLFFDRQTQTSNGYYQSQVEREAIAPVPVLSGAYFLTRKEIFETAGGFDERYFMYAEDIDLSQAINNQGFETVYYGASTIVHFKGVSTEKDKKYISRFYGAMKAYVRKHNGLLASIPLLAGIWVRQQLELFGVKKKSLPNFASTIISFEEYQSFQHLIEHIKNHPFKHYNIQLPGSNNIIG
jgi:GT2 family glycosyltransferase